MASRIEPPPQEALGSMPWLRWFAKVKVGLDSSLRRTAAYVAGNLVKFDAAGDMADSGKAPPAGAIVGTSDAQTLTNKTLDGDQNTITDLSLESVKADPSNAGKFLVRDSNGEVVSDKAVPTGDVVGTSDSQTLTGKTIDGDSNTVQDLALSSLKTVLVDANKLLARDGTGAVVSTAAPTIADFTSAQHDHQDADDGGQLDHGAALTAASRADDDHPGHPWGAGRSGGQTIKGGTGASEKLQLSSTDHATKGDVESDSRIVGVGAGQLWIDENIDLIARPTGASAPGLVALNGGTIDVYAFDGLATVEQLFGKFEYNHNLVEGADITPHIHWLPTTNGAGNVKWNLTYTWTNVDDAEPAETTISVTQATLVTAWKNQKVSFSAISGTGKLIGSQFSFRLWRDPTDAADTYGADAAIKTFGFHVLADCWGSRQMTVK